MLNNLEFTYIGKKTNLEGHFSFSGDTKIAGIVKGEIQMIDSSKLTLEISSVIEGKIQCQNIDIYGNFTGELNINGTLTLFPSAFVEGKISAKHIEILPGAILNATTKTFDS